MWCVLVLARVCSSCFVAAFFYSCTYSYTMNALLSCTSTYAQPEFLRVSMRHPFPRSDFSMCAHAHKVYVYAGMVSEADGCTGVLWAFDTSMLTPCTHTLHTYICIYGTCTRAHMHKHIHAHERTHAHTHAHKRTHIHTRLRIYINIQQRTMRGVLRSHTLILLL